MPAEVRALFDQVEAVVRLLLRIPESLAEVERSFSGLKRLKIWLISTLSQPSLNHVAMRHVYQKMFLILALQKSVNSLLREMMGGNDRRRCV